MLQWNPTSLKAPRPVPRFGSSQDERNAAFEAHLPTLVAEGRIFAKDYELDKPFQNKVPLPRSPLDAQYAHRVTPLAGSPVSAGFLSAMQGVFGAVLNHFTAPLRAALLKRNLHLRLGRVVRDYNSAASIRQLFTPAQWEAWLEAPRRKFKESYPSKPMPDDGDLASQAWMLYGMQLGGARGFHFRGFDAVVLNEFYQSGSMFKPVLIPNILEEGQTAEIEGMTRHETGHFIGGKTRKDGTLFQYEPGFLERIEADMTRACRDKLIPCREVEPGQFEYQRYSDDFEGSALSLGYYIPVSKTQTGRTNEVFAEVTAATQGGGGYPHPEKLLDVVYPTTAEYLRKTILPEFVASTADDVGEKA